MIVLRCCLTGVLATALVAAVETARAEDDAKPLTVGETFSFASKVLGEQRRINVYLPQTYQDSRDLRLPVLYMPDGGLNEDFLHIAGLLQVSIGNGTVRPFLLVGIENTDRRRDLTGPTKSPTDRSIAKAVGGSQAFRAFIRQELMPQVNLRYRTTKETAIVGESLAGLFATETFLVEPDLFDAYVVIDPSLWWNDQALVRTAPDRLRSRPKRATTFYMALSSEEKIEGVASQFVDALRKSAPAEVRWHYKTLPDEKHATVFHPAALTAFRTVFKPPAAR